MRRPEFMITAGRALHPEAITDAWYAADCPPRLDARAARIPLTTRIRWRVACWLRGAKINRQPAGPRPARMVILEDPPMQLNDTDRAAFDALRDRLTTLARSAGAEVAS